MPLDKEARFALFLARLESSTPANTLEEALEMVCRVLNTVEDEFTTIPQNPASWQTDGRMYPPEQDSIRNTNFKDVKRFRTRSHNLFVGFNGSIRIEEVLPRRIVLKKAGSDGKMIPAEAR